MKEGNIDKYEILKNVNEVEELLGKHRNIRTIEDFKKDYSYKI